MFPAAEVDALEASLDRLKPRREELSLEFFRRFFDGHPEREALFRSGSVVHGRKLSVVLMSVIANARTPHAMGSLIQQLRHSHSAAGVGPEHCEPFVDVLVGVIGKFSAPEWSPDLEDVWRRALLAIATLVTAPDFPDWQRHGEGAGAEDTSGADAADPSVPSDDDLLRRSLPLLLGDARFFERFYQALWARHPDMRDLFGETVAAQQHKLATALINIVTALEQPKKRAAMYHSLGARHATAGIQRDHYAPFIDVLVARIEETARPALGERVGKVWRAALEDAATAMLAPGSQGS